MSTLREDSIRRIEELKALGVNPYGYKYNKELTIGDLRTKEVSEAEFQTAGRIKGYRLMGKNLFLHLEDQTGIIQCYIKENEVGESQYEIAKMLRTGDFLGVKGNLFLTKTEELTLRVKSFELCGVNIQPLPDKHAGLTDEETKIRQRYLDFAMSAESRDKILQVGKLLQYFRQYFYDLNYLEVETPMLHGIASGAAAKPFVTHLNALDQDMYLRISPELYLKRLLVGGFDKVFELNRNFRNEGISQKHNPEFTMCEFYQAYANLETMMDETEGLFKYLAKTLYGRYTFTIKGHVVDLEQPFQRITMADCIAKYTNRPEIKDYIHAHDFENVKRITLELGTHVGKNETLSDLMIKLFDEFCEEQLVQPTFLIEYPVDISPLTKDSPTRPGFVDRFELFVGGFEFANAYSELNDPIEQDRRFATQAERKEAGLEEQYEVDEDFVNALEIGMPCAGGCGIGFSRLTMLFTESDSIRSVLPFPFIKQ